MPSRSISIEVRPSATDDASAAAAAGPAAIAALTHGPLDSDRASDLAGAFKALGDPVRLRLLSMIASAPEGEICVCELGEAFPLTGPTISHHLRILREAGLVRGARRGTWVYYRALPGELTRLAEVLDAGPRGPAAR
ncbi:metalloregulator ArsR/SmtB family transcription factor [Actinoplanes sp. NEAU-A12]|uniref:Metalloregulator ArsR/SmtB family transcription factor n=1 Tax=Actinoplanes sandaracinus TaxID=3045177 RepID=A0ABT6WXT0_9ACTN|nr:metalloregulator ArsR/SmtB family transcription factor [Actinoplanes sandaracinus]MDI6104550.1 metalloregulator ArsR/SmtB family transcription factor [Actinoplanes sandaracinus]